MPITVNDGGVLRTLSEISVNDGGVLRKLSTVHANDGGVLRQVFSAGAPVNSLNLGSTVKLKLNNGSFHDFFVICKGKPSSIYDNSCDGIWLLKETAWTQSLWTYDERNRYLDSYIRVGAESYYNQISSDIRPMIKLAKIPYMGASAIVMSGANGDPRHFFALSSVEIGAYGDYYVPPNGDDGVYIPLAHTYRICHSDGGAAIQSYTRSPYTHTSTKAIAVNTSGNGVPVQGDTTYAYIRPACVLSYSAKVDKDGYITA